MKNTLISFVMASVIATSVAFAQDYAGLSNVTSIDDGFCRIREEIISVKPGENITKILLKKEYENVQDVEFIDSTLSRFGFLIYSISNKSIHSKYPLLFGNWMNKRAHIKKMSKEYKSICESHSQNFVLQNEKIELSLDELVSIFGDLFTPLSEVSLDLWKKRVQHEYFKEVKKHFRKSGRSFVRMSDGGNPVKPYMDAITDALNAPRFEGFDSCMDLIGREDIRLDMSKAPSAEEVISLNEKAIKGEVKLTNPDVKVKLVFGLGVDGYNEFVKKYNGD